MKIKRIKGVFEILLKDLKVRSVFERETITTRKGERLPDSVVMPDANRVFAERDIWLNDRAFSFAPILAIATKDVEFSWVGPISMVILYIIFLIHSRRKTRKTQEIEDMLYANDQKRKQKQKKPAKAKKVERVQMDYRNVDLKKVLSYQTINNQLSSLTYNELTTQRNHWNHIDKSVGDKIWNLQKKWHGCLAWTEETKHELKDMTLDQTRSYSTPPPPPKRGEGQESEKRKKQSV